MTEVTRITVQDVLLATGGQLVVDTELCSQVLGYRSVMAFRTQLREGKIAIAKMMRGPDMYFTVGAIADFMNSVKLEQPIQRACDETVRANAVEAAKPEKVKAGNSGLTVAESARLMRRVAATRRSARQAA